MKILIIQEKGRHPENEQFREALNFHRAFKRLGIGSTVFGLGYNTEPFQTLEDSHDVILLLENYESGNWIPDFSMSGNLKIFWSIDSHCALKSHIKTCERLNIDILLNSTESYLQHFKHPNRRCIWFPNCYPSDLIGKREGVPKHGVGFCGNPVNRGEQISYLINEVGMRFDRMILGESMVKAVNSYAIGWNKNMANDINYRTFETLGCGTFLLTNYTSGLEKIFNIGEHLITYSSMKDCVEKMKYYLKNDSEREEIAQRGHEHVLKNHTYDVRAQHLIEIIGKGK